VKLSVVILKLIKSLQKLSATCIVILLISSIWFVSHSFNVKGDVLDLLISETDNQADIYSIAKNLTREHSKDITVLINGPDSEITMAALASLVAELEVSPEIKSLTWEFNDSSVRQLLSSLSPYRYRLLSSKKQSFLENIDSSEQFLLSYQESLHSPTSAPLLTFLPDDPLLFLPDYLWQTLPQMGNVESDGQSLILPVVEEFTRILFLHLTKSPFESAAQAPAMQTLQGSIENVQSAFPEVSIEWSGPLKFAYHSASSMQQETTVIAIFSAAGVLLLTFFIFRSFVVVGFALLSIAAGLLFGLASTLWFFGEIHLVTLGFGASLIGACVDYCLHVLCEVVRSKKPAYRLVYVLKALVFGAATSICAFLALMLTPIPGLQELAVFSIFGLLGSLLFVIGFINYIPVPAAAGSFVFVSNLLNNAFFSLRKFYASHFGRATTVVLVGLSIFSLSQVSLQDDMRSLQDFPDALLEADTDIRKKTGLKPPGALYLIEASDFELGLRRMEKLCSKIRALPGHEVFCLSDLLPSMATQDRSAALVERVIFNEEKDIRHGLNALGLDADLINKVFAKRPSDSPYVTLESWKDSPLAERIDDMMAFYRSQQYLFVPVFFTADSEMFRSLDLQVEGVIFVDHIASLNELFSSYRRWSVISVSIAYALIYIFMIAVYGLKKGTCGFLPCAITVGLVLGSLSLLGFSVSFWSLFALILVLGLSIDYAFFLLESDASKSAVPLAIALSVASTFLSFGLLAFSSSPILSAFGASLSLGLCFILLLSPIILSYEKT